MLGWKSGLIKKVCRSTFRAETQGMLYGVERGQNMRAVLAVLRGKLRKGEPWEEVATEVTKQVWMTDCQSLHDYLVNPIAAGCEDKRLEIDLEDLREYLWFWPDGSLKDDHKEEAQDMPRWIDTSTMICDPLTKAGNADFCSRLISTCESGMLNLEASETSQIRKMKQQKARAAKADLKKRPESANEAWQFKLPNFPK